MSLLHQEPSNELDAAALGEELTKGTSPLVWARLIATAVVTLAIIIYFVSGQKPSPATGEILEVWAHPMHTVTPGFDAGGAAMPQQAFDQVLVFTRVRLHNQSKQPLFLYQITTNTTLDDGIHVSYATTASEYERVFLAYPQLAPWHSKALSPQATIDPGQTQEGTIVSSYRLTKEQWEARKNLNFTFAFRYQPNLTLASQVAVIEH
jgi:hypothetical protein